jgi:selenide,water dikinase
MVGGHTIADAPPKYGLAVTGVVDPRRVITNAQAEPGQVLILAKPIGTGTILAGQRVGEAKPDDIRAALESMKLLNRRGAEIMQEFGVRCATDITGFGLLGHALHIAHASHVTLDIDAHLVPLLPGAMALAELGCTPGGAFRNLSFVEGECRFAPTLAYPLKLLLVDPQTSGGLLLAAPLDVEDEILAALRAGGYPAAVVIGSVQPPGSEPLRIGG